MNARQGAPRAGALPGGLGGPLNLIHRNKVPNPALARLPARFDFPEGVPVGVLFDALKLPFPVAVEVLRRASQ